MTNPSATTPKVCMLCGCRNIIKNWCKKQVLEIVCSIYTPSSFAVSTLDSTTLRKKILELSLFKGNLGVWSITR